MSAKTKDGFYKVNYDNTYVLLANGSQKQFGNDTNNIPVSNGIVNSNLNADLLDGLHIHTGINNEVNKIVRTNSDGTIMAGWINTISGDMTTTPFTRVYVSNDNYIRYVSNTNFIKGIGGPFLPLVGGTMTGTIHREYSSSDDTPFIWINSGDYDNYIFQVSSSTVSHQYFGYSLKYIGTGSGIKKFLRLYADNQNSTDIIALSVNQSGNIGIGDDALDSYRLYVSGNSVFYGHLYPEATNTYDLGSSSLRWRKLYIGTADSYGTTTKPIYWNNGVPTACTYSLSADVNSGTKDTLAYYSTATSISSYTSTIGSNTKLFYLNAGVPIESTGNVGSGVIPIYLLGGTLIASTSTVGATNKPIWLSSGTLTQFNSTIGATNQPIFLNNGEIIATTANIGSGVKPIYMSSGQILASTSTIGGTLQPVWLNTGIITAFTTTKGSPTTGVYLASGVISEMTYSLGSSVSAGTENRIAWYSGANVISSGTVTTDGEYLGSISYLSINKEHQTGYRLYVNGTSYLSDISLIANSTIIVPTVSYSTLISSYGLRSDYTSVGHPTEDFLKAWCKWVYAQNNVPDHTVHSYISPNSRGYIVADVYASGINSTTGLPEHITGRYYPHGGGEIIFGTSYGTWYYRNAYDDSYHPNADYIYVEATSTGDWLYPNFTYYGNTYRREYVYTKLRFQPSTGHLLINGAFDNSPQKYDDGNDRPGISILGSYPQLALISNVSNSSHGPVLAIGAYDNSGTNSGSFKSFRFGTPGVSATWLDLAYGTHSNVHDGIAGWNASGNGLQITRFHNDRTIYNYGTVYFGVASYGATYYHSGYTVYSYDKVSHYSYTYGRSIIGDSSMWTWTLGVNGRVGIATNDATDPGYLNIAHNTFAINFRQGGSWTTGFFYGTYGNEYIALTTQQSVTSIIFGNGYAPNSLTSGSFISGDGGHGYGTSTDIIQIKQNCMNIGDIWTNGVGPDYKLKVNGRTRINYTGGDTDPSLVVTATSNGSWRYVAAFLAPNLTSGYNVYVPVGTELSTRNAIGLTHYTYGSGSTSNYAAMEIWGVGNIQRWYYGDMRTWFAGRVDASGFYHNSYGSYDYLLTSNGDARHMNTLTVSNSDMLDGYHHDHFQVRHWTTQRDFADGTLIYTDINYSNWSGDPFYGVISGNTYGRIGSAYTTFQGYLWDDGIINYSVSNLGIESIGDIIAMNISGNLCFWFPRQSYWEGYSVEVYSAYDYRTNRVTNVVNNGDPGGSKRVNLNNNTYYNFHNGNSFWADQPVRNYSTGWTSPWFDWSNIHSWCNIESGGVYFNGRYGAHFQPNDWSSYGQFIIRGSKNGYSGIHFGESSHYMTLMDNYTDKGIYQEDQRWILYYNASNGKVSLRDSSDFGADINLNGSVRTNSTYYGYGLYHLSYGSSDYFLTSDGSARYWPDLYDGRYYRHFNTENISMGSFWCGYGTGMTTQIGPTGHWWHIFSSGWSDNTYWISQIAVPTADGWDSNHMMYRTYHGSDYGWRTVLDNTNYTSYTDGRYLRYEGWWNSGSGQNVDDAHGIIFAYSDHGVPGSWGTLLSLECERGNGYRHQIHGRCNANELWHRYRNGDNGSWSGWAKVLDTDNTYVSGSWGYINGTRIDWTDGSDRTAHLLINGVTWWSNWYWSGQSGQPTWIWGSNDGTNMYVWNPSNFSVNYANYAGYLTAYTSWTGGTGANMFYLWYDWNNTGSLGTYFHGIWAGSPDENIGFDLAYLHGDYYSLYMRSWDYGGWNGWTKLITTSNVSSTLWWADQTVKTYADSGTWPTFGSCYVNDWVRIGNSTGIYWNGVYGAHFRVNLASSYGQFQILGNKNGYSGFHFGDSTGWMTIMDNYTDKGCYQENWGWLWYFNASNGTLGLRTSSNTGYAVTCQGDFYCRGGWLRTEGGTGWYNESYGGGIWMADGTYVRVYNSKRFWVDNVTHCSSASESVWPGDAAIEVRERGRGTTGISHDYANAPRIGFHWGNRYWANFVYFDNWFRFMTESCGGYIGNMASCYSLNGYTGNYTGTSWTIAGYAGQLYFGGNFHIDSQNGYHLYLNYYTSYNIYACYGGGTFYAAQGYFYVNTSGAYHTSDIRKKYDIRDILYKDINDLFKTENGYIRYFKWKETDKPAYGFIAQEIQDYCPECIELDKTGYYSVNYNVALSKIIGVLFKKVKEQDRIIKDLQKRMEEF